MFLSGVRVTETYEFAPALYIFIISGNSSFQLYECARSTMNDAPLFYVKMLSVSGDTETRKATPHPPWFKELFQNVQPFVEFTKFQPADKPEHGIYSEVYMASWTDADYYYHYESRRLHQTLLQRHVQCLLIREGFQRSVLRLVMTWAMWGEKYLQRWNKELSRVGFTDRVCNTRRKVIFSLCQSTSQYTPRGVPRPGSSWGWMGGTPS